MRAKYVHTNLIAQDWKRLEDFYSEVFGCTLVPPERDYQGEALDAGTGLKGARLRGVHMRLPGYEGNGPTLEIYTYDSMKAHPGTAVNRPGFGHIAFEVDDVRAAAEIVKSRGGAAVGEIVTLTTKTGAQVNWCYMTDPEGNILELQSWAK
ncbi:MAG: VOC family protein [Chloroflexi bacterium]|nr:VOC family protein [Chloroflexota bacterium]